MDLEIVALEKAIENALNESPLPAEVKRLMLVELAVKMAEQSQKAVREQMAESKKKEEKDAESV